jgi:hypothetical protein
MLNVKISVNQAQLGITPDAALSSRHFQIVPELDLPLT